ncbi:hypothetical protein XELAEV_18036645mg [Xenopus laevis]|uniref:Uncharacterized protein n=1 Tax=Xenopus laevis TaxID=8355 RepID=A0A974H9X4_XENLA|nr:hypothetical protein XELAEV_18036645mg [Xenopus laevis]
MESDWDKGTFILDEINKESKCCWVNLLRANQITAVDSVPAFLSDGTAYSPHRLDVNVYSPHRLDVNVYSPHRSDGTAYSPHRLDVNVYSPHRLDVNVYSPYRLDGTANPPYRSVNSATPAEFCTEIHFSKEQTDFFIFNFEI